ncbi:transducin family protein [Tripterygium wilfordii]|uniref:Transducin family protein n=1 Tax=Tripterygium wilfordii TaxID=458696 RepID=A0A7J7CZV0_TRIWF|nr:denticleless protein homolog [Tripterygium wilfordii]KAF5739603.1 transducin family protein [Tripterygium wilfordii]
MESINSQSFFRHIRSRELSGFRVRKRPYIGELASDFSEIGTLVVEHGGEETPPLAMSFCKTSKCSHVLAVADEDGYVSLFDTRRKFTSFASPLENTGKARANDWVAHQNAIFDVCWIKEDTNILTASGDQTIRLWDAKNGICTGVLTGHTGSVKSVSCHPTNSDLIVSGSRDGSFTIWDLRCKTSPKGRRSDVCIASTAMVKGAHVSPQTKRIRRGKAASMSITSVLYLKDEVSIASAGATDSTIKFWDTRNLKTHITQACIHPESSAEKDKVLHGISSLSQDSNGMFLTASCMDNRIYLYNVLQLDKGPVQSFSGCQIESFYVKAAISPDGAHIISGSSNGSAYVWQVDRPQGYPSTLKSHRGEVTAVDWCSSEVGKLATSADDFTVCIWNIKNSYCSSARSSSSSIRRRVMALPSEECRELLMNGNSEGSKESLHIAHVRERVAPKSPINPIKMPTISTPEAQMKKVSSSSDSNETLEKTPEAMKSPSILSPPSSLKRTIRDYFVAAS